MVFKEQNKLLLDCGCEFELKPKLAFPSYCNCMKSRIVEFRRGYDVVSCDNIYFVSEGKITKPQPFKSKLRKKIQTSFDF